MRLTGLSYKTTNWELKEIEFEEVSLLVGKNATGKTRTLRILHLLNEIICQKTELSEPAEWAVRFSKEKDTFEYKFGIRTVGKGYFIKEKMTINDELFFERVEDIFQIKNVLTQNFENGFPPANKLVIHVLRDTKKYPYIEDIVKWAEQSFGFKFANVYSSYGINSRDYGLLSEIDHFSRLLNRFGDENRNTIIREIDSVGFPVENLGIYEVSALNTFVVKERGIIDNIFEDAISQGMFRSLAVLIFVEYLVSKKSTATIIIDDLCEGLDYERATKLGRLLFDKCIANNIQLIATSNDMFLMDVVDLKYWNVLQRTGHIVTAVNAKNHPELFEDFKFTGLSNFDFFASDYIAQNL